MTDQRYSADEAETLMKLMGPEEGKAFFARNPQLAPGTEKEYPTVQEDPLDTTDTEDTEDTGGVADISGEGLSVTGLAKDTLNYQKRMQDLRMKQFEAARNAIKERQGGPSLSARLAELSAAFFRPKYTRGYAGTMANIMPVLARQQAATDEGDDKKADVLRELQDKYDTGTLSSEGDLLNYRIKLAQLAKKSTGQPRWSDAQGRFFQPGVAEMTGKSGTIKAADGNTHRFVDFSDGTRHVEASPGVWDVIDDAGNVLGQADARGNPINGTP